MKFFNLNIGARLGFGFSSVLLLMALMMTIGLKGMSSIHARINKIVDVNVVQMDLLQEMSESVHIVSKEMGALVLAKDEKDIEKISQLIEEARKKYDAAFSKLETKQQKTADKELLQLVLDAQNMARAENNAVVELARKNLDEDASDRLIKKAEPLNQTWQDALDESIALQRRENANDAIVAAATYNDTMETILMVSIVSLITGIAIAIWITRSISRPIRRAMLVAQTVSAGDLTSKIDITFTDETGKLLEALREMNDSLTRIVTQIRGGTEAIATASGQIATGNLDLSARTEEQASSLEEIASSMEELTSTVQQNADNARRANQLALASSTIAAKGVAVMSQVVDTMRFIQSSANRISDIIGVIDGIAFQTNILALNAAVEAARAGEQGKGFAVVAGEVRNLAQRSSVAAKDIRDLIIDSVEKINEGSQLVDGAGQTMDEIVKSAKQVNEIMDEIASASSEQSSGIHQVNQALSEMDQVTQQNAALVEEAAAAAESLREQAANLAAIVSIFKLEHTEVLPTLQNRIPSLRLISATPLMVSASV